MSPHLRAIDLPSKLPSKARPQVGRTGALTSIVACLALIGTLAGCKSKAVDDASLTTAVSAQLTADSSLAGQQIQPSVQAGVVTLNGGVLNDAQRTIAARDASAVPGIKEVVNNLSLASAVAATTAPAPLPVQRPRTSQELPANSRSESPRDPYPSRATPSQPQNYPPSAPVQRPTQSLPPRYRTLTLQPGSAIPVRVTQSLDSATTQPGDSFSGVIASDVIVDGLVAIPAGAAVTGNVDAVQEAAHFKGNSLLTISLTGIRNHGDRIALSTNPYTVTGKGRGKNTAEKAGGGAAVGAVLGGIFGGGKGAAIGAGVGGGAGLGANALTRGQQVQIPSETVVRFTTASPITITARSDNPGRSDQDPNLQHRPE